VLGGNEREARKRLTRFLSTKRGPLPQQVDLAIHHPEAVYHYLKNRFVDRKLPPGWIVGTPEQCTARLLEYVNIGVENFMVDVVDAMNPHTLQMFADEVAVHLDLKRS
jgi:alkanesulfonate monooxygenase SsuD/methylene tetrahydromethanopterin reductase-like flavin-dependent oxidoreductase (luciferase family)